MEEFSTQHRFADSNDGLERLNRTTSGEFKLHTAINLASTVLFSWPAHWPRRDLFWSFQEWKHIRVASSGTSDWSRGSCSVLVKIRSWSRLLDNLELRTRRMGLSSWWSSGVLASIWLTVQLKHYVISNTAVTKQDFLQILIFWFRKRFKTVSYYHSNRK